MYNPISEAYYRVRDKLYQLFPSNQLVVAGQPYRFYNRGALSEPKGLEERVKFLCFSKQRHGKLSSKPGHDPKGMSFLDYDPHGDLTFKDYLRIHTVISGTQIGKVLKDLKQKGKKRSKAQELLRRSVKPEYQHLLSQRQKKR